MHGSRHLTFIGAAVSDGRRCSIIKFPAHSGLDPNSRLAMTNVGSGLGEVLCAENEHGKAARGLAEGSSSALAPQGEESCERRCSCRGCIYTSLGPLTSCGCVKRNYLQPETGLAATAASNKRPSARFQACLALSHAKSTKRAMKPECTSSRLKVGRVRIGKL